MKRICEKKPIREHFLFGRCNLLSCSTPSNTVPQLH